MGETSHGDRHPGSGESESRRQPPIGRLVVVHALGRSSAIGDQLRTSSIQWNPVAVARSLLNEIAALNPDVVVIEHTEDFDVLRVCRDIRTTVAARIIAMAGKSADDEDLQIALLGVGADDFLPTSISTPLLLARIKAAMRGQGDVPRHTHLSIGDTEIDVDAHAVRIDGRVVNLAPLQFKLLVVLATQPNTVISRENLVTVLWGSDAGSRDPRRLRIVVSLLRRALGKGVARPCVEGIPRVGYRLVVPTER